MTSVAVAEWFRVAHATGRRLRFEIPRDPATDPADAGHLAIQELVLRATRSAGYARFFELPTRSADPARSTDVGLRVDRLRLLILIECWNTLRDLGASARATDRKLAEAAMLAATLGEGSGYAVRGCWVLRDTAANRTLLARYPEIFATRFPGSSLGWLRALTAGSGPPTEPGLVWCDGRATRLFARRQ